MKSELKSLISEMYWESVNNERTHFFKDVVGVGAVCVEAFDKDSKVVYMRLYESENISFLEVEFDTLDGLVIARQYKEVKSIIVGESQ